MPAKYKIFGVPAESFRSTVAEETVVEYIKRAGRIFDGRRPEPLTPLSAAALD